MRASDKTLHDALKREGLDDLAERAAAGEWNDYFGKHAMNMNHLAAVLRSRQHAIFADLFAGDGPPNKLEVEKNRLKFEGLLRRVMSGDFDATQQEAREWGQSDEGREVFGGLVGGR